MNIETVWCERVGSKYICIKMAHGNNDITKRNPSSKCWSSTLSSCCSRVHAFVPQ